MFILWQAKTPGLTPAPRRAFVRYGKENEQNQVFPGIASDNMANNLWFMRVAEQNYGCNDYINKAQNLLGPS